MVRGIRKYCIDFLYNHKLRGFGDGRKKSMANGIQRPLRLRFFPFPLHFVCQGNKRMLPWVLTFHLDLDCGFYQMKIRTSSSTSFLF